ncbi:MAG: SpoIIE family protein phosphatase [Elusimicrobiota bacterium]|jgi:hypothetical protein|nr:SpoIIE family protein phosphatase [Elusimicrobiota bacterium]
MTKVKSENIQYVQTFQFCRNKQNNFICGDEILIKRGKDRTLIIVIDGVGSGMRANICASLFGSELMSFLDKDYSLIEACRLVVESIKIGKRSDNFAAFSAATVLHTGHVQIVSYEAPEPVYIDNNFAYVPKGYVRKAGSENLIETNFMLGENKAFFLFSDGVSQSGMGRGFGYGIGSAGVADILNDFLKTANKYEDAAKKVLDYCYSISGSKWEDDTSAVLITPRKAITANILTGPPSSKSLDEKFVKDFEKAIGFKIISGSTTLDIYCRHTGGNAKMLSSFNPFEAPVYKIDNIDFASEGAIMLNQLYNLYELNPSNLDTNASITKLKELLDISDKICFFLGKAENQEQNNSMMFSQLRIFPRKRIIKLLSEKFKEQCKVVSVKEY